MADYSSAPSAQFDDTLIPDGTLARGFLKVRPHNLAAGAIETPPKKGKNNYLDCEITIVEGPHMNRKVWTKIMRGPDEKSLNMGNAQMKAILEFGFNASPTNPAGYRLPDDYAPLWDENQGGGCPVGIKIKLEPAKGEYKAKNDVSMYLTPNPDAGAAFKEYQRLVKGDTAPANAAPAAKAAPAAQPAWQTQPAQPAPQPMQQPTSHPVTAAAQATVAAVAAQPWGNAGSPGPSPAQLTNGKPGWLKNA